MKKIVNILLATCLIFSLPACSAQEEKDPEPVEPIKEEKQIEKIPLVEDQEMLTINVAYMPNMGSGSSLITGVNMGYFKEVGLDLRLIEFPDGPSEIKAMGLGEIDIAQIGHGAHALVVKGEAKIVAMDQLTISDELLANKALGIKSSADLKGKKIASTPGTSADVILDLALQEAGLTRADVEVIEKDAKGAVSAMLKGEVDAVATWSPNTLIIKQEMEDHVISLGSNADYMEAVIFPSSFITTDKFAAEEEEVLVSFIAALMRAQDYRNSNIDEVAVWFATLIDADPDLILQTRDEGKWLTGEFLEEAVVDGTIEKYYENQQKLLLEGGYISDPVPVKDYVLFDIMKKGVDAYRVRP